MSHFDAHEPVQNSGHDMDYIHFDPSKIHRLHKFIYVDSRRIVDMYLDIVTHARDKQDVKS